ncbi:MAG: DUF4249 domain-containing protein [Tenuifilaceae bacterium]|jgi:hypothetical protein|nr:DUF4249 domain-containing protein [Tenuifilaceae bacterium]
MKTRVLGILIMLTGVLSCIDDVDDLNLPKVEPKIVVQSFICPNESIKVMVWQSKPINYNTPAIDDYSDENNVIEVQNALVVLKNTDGTQEVVIPFVNELRMYTISPAMFEIVMGGTYYLSVSVPGFDEVKASTRVPSYAPILMGVELDTSKTDEWGDLQAIISGSIVDEASSANFYALFAFDFGEYSSGYNNNYLSVYNDLGCDGQNIPFRIDFSLSSYSDHRIRLYALTVDKHYYKFHKSLNTVDDFGDNPFAEATPLYSNIEGGLGVFASYLSTVIILSDKGQ